MDIRYLSADVSCVEERSVRSKTESFEKKIISEDKYPSIESIKSFCLRAIGLNGSRDRIFPS